jgi:hypothetical protein
MPMPAAAAVPAKNAEGNGQKNSMLNRAYKPPTLRERVAYDNIYSQESIHRNHRRTAERRLKIRLVLVELELRDDDANPCAVMPKRNQRTTANVATRFNPFS